MRHARTGTLPARARTGRLPSDCPCPPVSSLVYCEIAQKRVEHLRRDSRSTGDVACGRRRRWLCKLFRREHASRHSSPHFFVTCEHSSGHRAARALFRNMRALFLHSSGHASPHALFHNMVHAEHSRGHTSPHDLFRNKRAPQQHTERLPGARAGSTYSCLEVHQNRPWTGLGTGLRTPDSTAGERRTNNYTAVDYTVRR
jgi:hypothetical protein